MVAKDSASDLLTSRVNSVDASMITMAPLPEDIAGMTDAAGMAAIKGLAGLDCTGELANQGRALEEILLSRGPVGPLPKSQVLQIWIGRQFLRTHRYAAARVVGEALLDAGPQWQRHGAKLIMWSLIRGGGVGDSLEFAASWIQRDSEYVSELPFSELFSGRDWADFREFDPVLVGLVAHHAHVSTAKGRVGFICKMACRKFAMEGGRSALQTIYGSSSEDYRSLLTLFLRDAWIEENLSMNHLLVSADDVRTERMEICQTLMTWDPARSAAYIDAIKLLTVDEALRKGLRHINQTRIFVNDSGLARWAERDLLQEFDRWKALVASDVNPSIESSLVRQYSVDPASLDFFEALTEEGPRLSDAQLTAMLDRMFRRFLTDPADGLDSYLSLRIRHGSLRGTLFGPLEEHGLVYSQHGSSRDAFDDRWALTLGLDDDTTSSVFELLKHFSALVGVIADELVNEKVQVRSAEKPNGAILQRLHPGYARVFLTAIETDLDNLDFDLFVYVCIFVFWRSIEPQLIELASHVRSSVKANIQREVDGLVHALRLIGHGTLPIVTVATSVGTTLQSQCDSIADWFRIPDLSQNEDFKLSVAIEVAKAATKNVYRAFPAEIDIVSMPAADPALSTRTLVGLTDALFVVLENIWKRSGLGIWVGPARLNAAFDSHSGLLTVSVQNAVSQMVRRELESGGLQEIHRSFYERVATERANFEGGSGFAKLALLCRSVDREICPEPLRFDLSEEGWITTFTMSLAEHDGVYEALQ
jgi:hypothetical protein